jgi:transcription elongation factor Elf1
VSRVYEKYKDEPGDVAHTVRLFGKFPPKAVESLCPFCEHYEVNKVFEKDTIVCQACERPFELYEDGRVEPSMLYEAVGTVNFRNHRGEFYTGNGPSMKTREDETN